MAKRGTLKWRENISKGCKASFNNRSGYWLGKKHTQEYKDKMSKALSGKNNPRYGVKLGRELKEKIRKSMLAHYKRNGTDYLCKPKKNHPTTFKSGKNHWNWKGGVTNQNQRVRASLKYKRWRISVFKRDDYTCQECDKRGRRLEADHLKPFSKYKELRFDINNGRTLCKECHMETENYAGRSVNYL